MIKLGMVVEYLDRSLKKKTGMVDSTTRQFGETIYRVADHWFQREYLKEA